MKHPRRKEGYMAIDPWYKAWHNLQNYQHKLYCSTEKNKHFRGYNYILFINERFCKFIKLYAVKNRTAKTAAKYVTD